MTSKVPTETQKRIWSAVLGSAIGSWLGLGALWFVHQVMNLVQ